MSAGDHDQAHIQIATNADDKTYRDLLTRGAFMGESRQYLCVSPDLVRREIDAQWRF